MNNKFDKECKSIINEYSMIKHTYREQYPRNLKGKLSASFIKSFEREFKKLSAEYNNDKKLLKDMQKALQFHIDK